MKDERIKALKKEIKRIKKENKAKNKDQVTVAVGSGYDLVFNNEDGDFIKRTLSNSLSNLFNTEKRTEVDENGKEWKIIEGFTKDNNQYENFYNVKKEWFHDNGVSVVNFEINNDELNNFRSSGVININEPIEIECDIRYFIECLVDDERFWNDKFKSAEHIISEFTMPEGSIFYKVPNREEVKNKLEKVLKIVRVYNKNTEDSKEFKLNKIKHLQDEIDNLNKELENFIIDWNNLNLMISRRDILQCELNKLININNNKGDEK